MTFFNQSGATLDKLTKRVSWLIPIAGVAFFIVIGIFIYIFASKSLTNNIASWGQFGEYVGGTLSPFLSFLVLISLVLTFTLQARQLEIAKQEVENSKQELIATREELKRTSVAQEATSKALSEQANFAAISARLAALRASLDVISENIRQSQGTSMTNTEFESHKALVRRKIEIANEILSITDKLKIASLEASP